MLSTTSSSTGELAADFAKLADIFATKGHRVAYENRCWSPGVRTWKVAWEVVKRADRPNLGLCLDTFQIVGGEFGDPTTASGLVEHISRAELETRWRASLRELSMHVPPEKIFVLQISDAYKMDPPFRCPTICQQPRSKWNDNHRALPLDGGYLPVHDVVRATLNTGYRSWLSIEVTDPAEGTDMVAFAQRAKTALQDLLLFS